LSAKGAKGTKVPRLSAKGTKVPHLSAQGAKDAKTG
jgi:hypothetical protein